MVQDAVVHAVSIVATAAIAGLALFAVAAPLRAVLPAQLALLPFADVYTGGIAVLASLLASSLATVMGGSDLPLSRFLLGFWLAWAGVASISFFASHATPRDLFQLAEFLMYGGIAILVAAKVQDRNRLIDSCLRGCRVGAALLSVGFVMFGATNTDTPAFGIGSNEGSFVIVVMGVVPALATVWTRPDSIGTTLLVLTQLVLAYAAVSAAESRSSQIVILALLLVTVVVRSVRRYRWKGILFWVGAVLISWVTAVPRLLAGVVADSGTNFSDLERVGLLVASWRLFAERPWFGWGWGSVDSLIPQVPETTLSYPHPHNTYAHFAVELGLPGLLLILTLYAALGFKGIALAHRRDPRAGLAWLLAVSLAVMSMVDDIFYGASRGVPAAALIGLVFGVTAASAPRLVGAASSGPSTSASSPGA